MEGPRTKDWIVQEKMMGTITSPLATPTKSHSPQDHPPTTATMSRLMILIMMTPLTKTPLTTIMLTSTNRDPENLTWAIRTLRMMGSLSLNRKGENTLADGPEATEVIASTAVAAQKMGQWSMAWEMSIWELPSNKNRLRLFQQLLFQTDWILSKSLACAAYHEIGINHS